MYVYVTLQLYVFMRHRLSSTQYASLSGILIFSHCSRCKIDPRLLNFFRKCTFGFTPSASHLISSRLGTHVENLPDVSSSDRLSNHRLEDIRWQADTCQVSVKVRRCNKTHRRRSSIFLPSCSINFLTQRTN